ncbi:MFS transporter [Brevibacterium casei]|uniref:Enterobactin exporter EntS n=4 Tax=Bacteria TaxID=2 RepID=A0A269ZE88_9MICO|nr:MFS transporter [Brevibacterium casei]MBE4694598.1 MFS transporter [Brevibacterium casei]MBY3577720.1 MFS transporter [Brevibacterium casei]MCT1766039.1 MFS transporter [Brevibacterium casei]MCT2358502.1 MFS transporter [Brevibacterium casei]PAK95276.1 MFS transporter [Brevibacterium casei]
MAHTFRSLAEPNYRHWFAGALISNTGTWMQRTAQDWLVLTYLTNNNASALGITMALQMGPQLIMFPFAGALADRFSKRMLLMVTQAALGAVGLLLFVLVVTDTIELWHVYVLALVLGLLATLDTPARQAFVSELVGERLLPNAVSLNSASFNGARMIGPAVAGVITALVGAGPVFLISGLGFAATLTVLIRLDRARLHPAGRRGGGGVLGGFRYLRTRPDVTIVLVVLFIVATFGFNFNIYTATMARIEFDKDASGFGLLNSVMAIGSVAGALASAKREKPRLRFIFGAAGGFGLSVGLASLITDYFLFAFALILVGFSSLTMMTSANAYVQTTTPASYRGRVMAIYAAVVMGGTPIGAPLAGWVADTFGPRMAMGVGAASGVLAFAVGLVWMVVAKNLRLSFDPTSRIRLHVSYHGHP